MKQTDKTHEDVLRSDTQNDGYQEEPGEAYMNPCQQKYFEKKLLALKKQLMQGNEKVLERLRHDATLLADISDQASQEASRRLDLRVQGRDHRLIKKIDDALSRLAHDQKIEHLDHSSYQYGYCDSCTEKIGLRRLEARPTANLCFDCKTLEELREKQRGK